MSEVGTTGMALLGRAPVVDALLRVSTAGAFWFAKRGLSHCGRPSKFCMLHVYNIVRDKCLTK
jgi:hypothetical protein